MTIKLLILVGTLGRGGAEKQLVNLLRFSEPNGIEVYLLNLSRSQGEYWEEYVKGLSIQYGALGPGKRHFARLLLLWRAVREWEPDIVLAWHLYTGGYVLPFRLFRPSFKLALGLRNDAAYILGDLGWALRLIRRADALIANTTAALSDLEGLEATLPSGYLLPNSVEVPALTLPFKESVEVVGLCGNVHERKGIDIFLRAVAILVARGRRERFVIAGRGATEPYERLAASLGLGEWIAFRGDVACADEICTYDLLVLSSRHEGCPNVLLEAMSRGIPIVATAVGGVPELIRHEREGLLCESGSPEALAAAMTRMMEETALRRRCAEAARRAVEKRTAEAIAEHEYVEILEAIRAQPKR